MSASQGNARANNARVMTGPADQSDGVMLAERHVAEMADQLHRLEKKVDKAKVELKAAQVAVVGAKADVTNANKALADARRNRRDGGA